MKNRYAIKREEVTRYAVGGTQPARWCVYDTWDDDNPVGFGIRKYEACGIAKHLNWLNGRFRSGLPKHGSLPYWEWECPGNNFGARTARARLAHHNSSLIGSYRYAVGKQQPRTESV